jgi:hypothetical protein
MCPAALVSELGGISIRERCNFLGEVGSDRGSEMKMAADALPGLGAPELGEDFTKAGGGKATRRATGQGSSYRASIASET